MRRDRRYWHDTVGVNYRMTNLQAAGGTAQMERVDEFVRCKQNTARLYDTLLGSLKGISLPKHIAGTVNSYWLYTILIEPVSGISRDELMAKLLMNGVETRPVFYPLHEMPPYKKYSEGRQFPVSEDISKRGISLPSAVTLTESEIRKVCSAMKSLLGVKSILINSA